MILLCIAIDNYFTKTVEAIHKSSFIVDFTEKTWDSSTKPLHSFTKEFTTTTSCVSAASIE
jgi:hypothetical protein